MSPLAMTRANTLKSLTPKLTECTNSDVEPITYCNVYDYQQYGKIMRQCDFKGLQAKELVNLSPSAHNQADSDAVPCQQHEQEAHLWQRYDEAGNILIGTKGSPRGGAGPTAPRLMLMSNSETHKAFEI